MKEVDLMKINDAVEAIKSKQFKNVTLMNTDNGEEIKVYKAGTVIRVDIKGVLD